MVDLPTTLYLKTMLRILILTLAIAFLGIAAATEHAPENTTAEQLIDRLHNTLLEVMRQAPELGYAGRFDTLSPVIDDSFDFPTIARIVVGRHWKKLDEAQQSRFLEVFARLSKSNYAARFDGFSGESFKFLAAEPQKRDYLLIKTELIKSDGGVVPLSYVVHPTEAGNWVIVNVIADGVSDLSLKRADYSAVIRDEGFDSLVEKLNAKVSGHGDDPG